MKFRLIIDKTKDEEIIATVHERSALTDQLEKLLQSHEQTDQICGYMEDEWRMLQISEIECFTVLDGKVCAIDGSNRQYRLKQRLYELEEILPSDFIRINKSAIANQKHIERFAVTYSGAVDAVFKCGYREYVSRRCLSQIKRRFEAK